MTMLETEEAVGQDGPPETEGTKFARAHHILLYFTAAVVVIWLLNGFYQVKSDEVAIVERLGSYVSVNGKTEQKGPGLHYKLPWPIDTVHRIAVLQQATLRVNAFDTSPEAYAEFRQQLQQARVPLSTISALFDPYLITADKSVVHMDISVVYRVTDPETWLNTISHSTMAVQTAGADKDLRQEVFQQIAQHAMISRVSHMTLEQVLFSDLGQLSATMQDTLEQAMQITDTAAAGGKTGLGVKVIRVDVVRARPPEAVRGAFDRVVQARLNLQRVTEEAKSQKDTTVRLAQGQTENMKTEARQYATERTKSAQGETERFKAVLEQYRAAPEATRFNLYAEAAAAVSGNNRRVWTAPPGSRITVNVDPPKYDASQVGGGNAGGGGGDANPGQGR